MNGVAGLDDGLESLEVPHPEAHHEIAGFGQLRVDESLAHAMSPDEGRVDRDHFDRISEAHPGVRPSDLSRPGRHRHRERHDQTE